MQTHFPRDDYLQKMFLKEGYIMENGKGLLDGVVVLDLGRVLA